MMMIGMLLLGLCFVVQIVCVDGLNLQECRQTEGGTLCRGHGGTHVVCDTVHPGIERLEIKGYVSGLTCSGDQLPSLVWLKVERTSATCHDLLFPGARVFIGKHECQENVTTTTTTTTTTTEANGTWPFPLLPTRPRAGDEENVTTSSRPHSTSSSTSSTSPNTWETTTSQQSTTIRLIFRASLSTRTYVYVYVLVAICAVSAIATTVTCLCIRWRRRRQAGRNGVAQVRVYSSIEEASTDETPAPETIGMREFVPDSPRRRNRLSQRKRGHAVFSEAGLVWYP